MLVSRKISTDEFHCFRETIGRTEKAVKAGVCVFECKSMDNVISLFIVAYRSPKKSNGVWVL